MYEGGSQRFDRNAERAGPPVVKSSERREADRHVFTASAEVREIGSGAKFTTRTTDLGPGGCFVDTMVPFPIGSRVQVSVRKDQHAFDAIGTVVYAQSGLGMGIAFDALDEQQRDALDAWLGELGWHSSASDPIPHAAVSPSSRQTLAGQTVNQQAALVRLVRLMIGKGLLTESEGASVLYDPVL